MRNQAYNIIVNIAGLFLQHERLLSFYAGSVFPKPVAFELQHALVHLVHASSYQDNDSKIKQYKHACAHLERGLLDAWKILLMSDSQNPHHQQCCCDAELFVALANCRLAEYFASNKNSSSVYEPNNAAKRYQDLFKKLCSGAEQKLQDINNRLEIFTDSIEKLSKQETSKGKRFFELLHYWAQYELLFSALTAKKDLPTLEKMLAACYSGFSSEKLESSINYLCYQIVTEIIRAKFANAEIAKTPERRARFEEIKRLASNVSGSCGNEFRRYLDDELLPIFGGPSLKPLFPGS